MRGRAGTSKGFTLIEMAIVAVVAIIILGIITVFWIQAGEMYRFSDNVISLSEQAMTALGEMTERFWSAQTTSIVISDNAVPNPPFASPPAPPAAVASGPGPTIDFFDAARQESVRYSFNPIGPASAPAPPTSLGASAPPNFGTIEERVWDADGNQLYVRTLAGFVESLSFNLNGGVVSINIVFHSEHIGPVTVPHQQSCREDHRFPIQTAVGTRDLSG